MNMTKKRVAELEGAQLDWAVAMAGEEWKTAHKHFQTMALDSTFKGVRMVDYGGGRLGPCVLDPANPFRQDVQVYNPSSDWTLGGPIIERERIEIMPLRGDDGWWAGIRMPLSQNKSGGSVKTGPTPLIAAMRAFVASKLGDEVEVPA